MLECVPLTAYLCALWHTGWLGAPTPRVGPPACRQGRVGISARGAPEARPDHGRSWLVAIDRPTWVP